MVWPKYAQIVHFPPVNGRLKVEVWGDDKPIQEIKGIGDLRTSKPNFAMIRGLPPTLVPTQVCGHRPQWPL